MASAQAKTMHERNGLPVLIVDRNDRPRWNDIWQGNPRLTKRVIPRCQRLINCGGARPYIAQKTSTNWIWKCWDIRPGDIYLTDKEKAFAASYAGRIMIEPNTKAEDSNKAWLWDRWQAVVDQSSFYFVQCCKNDAGPWLDDVKRVVTPSFRQACAVLAASRAFVGSEGGLHHAAAALGVPAVVLWGEFIDPSITGYPMHRNLRHANGTCGSRISCSSCRASMEAITVEEVLVNLEAICA